MLHEARLGFLKKHSVLGATQEQEQELQAS